MTRATWRVVPAAVFTRGATSSPQSSEPTAIFRNIIMPHFSDITESAPRPQQTIEQAAYGPPPGRLLLPPAHTHRESERRSSLHRAALSISPPSAMPTAERYKDQHITQRCLHSTSSCRPCTPWRPARRAQTSASPSGRGWCRWSALRGCGAASGCRSRARACRPT